MVFAGDRKDNEKVDCQKCGIRVLRRKLRKHQTKTCKYAKNKSTRKNIPAVPRGAKGGRIRQAIKAVQSTIGTVIKDKKLCPLCKLPFPKSDVRCPNCDHWRSTVSTYVSCSLCGRPYSPAEVIDHQTYHCPDAILLCIICHAPFARKIMTRHVLSSHRRSDSELIEDPVKRIWFANCFKYQKGKRGSGSASRERARSRSVRYKGKVGMCSQCGQHSMYNSDRCYSCGDK